MARVVELEGQLAVLIAEWATERTALLERISGLEGKIADLEKSAGRNSSNSSKPPSSDSGPAKSDRPVNANRAARRALGRRQGKQPGTPGTTLGQVSTPDEVIVHRPGSCRGCDRPLDDAEIVGTCVRQVFDVPVPRPVVTEHRGQRCRCVCGTVTAAVFPPEATAPACYGPAIKAHAVYLMTAQHLARERCAEALKDLFGVTVATGTLDNWMTQAATALTPFVTEVTGQLQTAPVVHADETSVRSGKTALWVHVVSTRLLTLLHVGRRDKATAVAGPLGGYTGTIVHDRLAMYFGLGAGHVLCNAHILRSLNEIVSNRAHHGWATGFIRLITSVKQTVDTARAAGEHRLDQAEHTRIVEQWDQLCGIAAAATPPPQRGRQLYGTNKDARNLAIALTKHRDLFLVYTTDFSLPFDNNLGERDLRMLKLQAKISGEFRSTTGAARFATIRSYISTTRKHRESVHQHLQDLFTPTGPWLPTPT